MLRRTALVLFLALAPLFGAAHPVVAASADAEPHKARLLALYQEAFRSELAIDEATRRTSTVQHEGRTVQVVSWDASTAKGAARAFVAPDAKSVLGVIHLSQETVDLWQLTGPAADSPVDVSVVDFPLSQRTGIGVGDLVCEGLTSLVAATVCTALGSSGSPFCGNAVRLASTALCVVSDERTGHVQWHYKEDDPMGLKNSVVVYHENYPYEGVYYNGQNYLCARSTSLSDLSCYRPQVGSGGSVSLVPTYVQYRSKIKWSDGSRSIKYFGTNRYDFWPDIAWHQSAYISDIGPHSIQIRVDQLHRLPDGTQQWLFVDDVTALTVVCAPAYCP